MQERKTRQQQYNSIVVVSIVVGNEQQRLVSNSGDFYVNKLSKTFADAVRLEESLVAEPQA